MLFSVVDDRSGVAYQEYRCVYGEDVEAGLRFLFNAMSEKIGFPFQGIPQMIYTDNGPIAKSRVFQQVMRYLKIELRTHLPAGGDGRRVTARSKGKVERPFRTVKEMHETLYHFHEPSTEEEANAWLMNFLLRYNSMQHRSEPHTRIEDWVDNLPPSGIRAMCSWERFRTFAREADRRKVGIDARVSADGVSYVVDPALAGETVVLWWGLFDNELYVEHGDQRFGPYLPDGGPIPLNHYRAFKKTTAEKQADRIEELAARLNISKAALEWASADRRVHSRTDNSHQGPAAPRTETWKQPAGRGLRHRARGGGGRGDSRRTARPSPASIQARECLQDSKIQVEGQLRRQGRAEQLPFPDNSFDFVTMGYALRHVTSLEETFASGVARSQARGQAARHGGHKALRPVWGRSSSGSTSGGSIRF